MSLIKLNSLKDFREFHTFFFQNLSQVMLNLLDSPVITSVFSFGKFYFQNQVLSRLAELGSYLEGIMQSKERKELFLDGFAFLP